MKKEAIEIGGTYLAKVGRNNVEVRIERELARGGWEGTSLASNKKVRIKNAQAISGPVGESTTVVAEPDEPAAEEPRIVTTESDGPAESDLVPLPKPSRAKKTKGGAKAAKAKAAKEPKEPKEPKPAKEKKLSGLDAAFQVLSHTGEPMRCADMVEKMLSTGLWKTGGKTPAATIYSAILREITTKGSASRFKKTDRGLFTANGK